MWKYVCALHELICHAFVICTWVQSRLPYAKRWERQGFLRESNVVSIVSPVGSIAIDVETIVSPVGSIAIVVEVIREPRGEYSDHLCREPGEEYSDCG